jgi:hypothetical protein
VKLALFFGHALTAENMNSGRPSTGFLSRTSLLPVHRALAELAQKLKMMME